MTNVTFETQDLRVRIEDKIARIDQRKLEGETWQEIDKDELPGYRNIGEPARFGPVPPL